MPTEFRFDELDLREEPVSHHEKSEDGTTNATAYCTQSLDCTANCCSLTCYC